MENESVYRIVSYSCGYVTSDVDNLTLKEAQNYYITNWSDFTSGSMRVFKDGEKIPYIDSLKALELITDHLGLRVKLRPREDDELYE